MRTFFRPWSYNKLIVHVVRSLSAFRQLFGFITSGVSGGFLSYLILIDIKYCVSRIIKFHNCCLLLPRAAAIVVIDSRGKRKTNNNKKRRTHRWKKQNRELKFSYTRKHWNNLESEQNNFYCLSWQYSTMTWMCWYCTMMIRFQANDERIHHFQSESSRDRMK